MQRITPCVCFVVPDCIDVLHRSEVARGSGLTHEERRETITAVKDMARALKDVAQKKIDLQPWWTCAIMSSTLNPQHQPSHTLIYANVHTLISIYTLT